MGYDHFNSVLLVDDQATMTSIYSKVMDELGVERVFIANSPTEALALFSEKSPDLILLDVKMPEKSGLDLLKEFRDLDPKCSVVMLTSVSEKNTVLECIQAGAKNYVLKSDDVTKSKSKLAKIIKSLDRSRVPKSALIVDDQETSIKIYSKILKDIGILEVEGADTVDLALKKMLSTQPELVLLDVNMPVKNGLDFLQELKSSGIAANVVMLTSVRDESVVRNCIAAGANHYVLKNENVDELKKSLLGAFNKLKLGRSRRIRHFEL